MFEGITLLDVVVVIIMAASVFTALKRGLTAEIIALVSTILGLILAIHLYKRAALLLIGMGFPEGPASEFVAFLLIFIATFLVGAVIRKMMFRAVQMIGLRWADRFLGGLFGALRGWLISVVLFLSLTAFPVAGDVVTRSRTAEFFLTSATMALQIAPRHFRERFAKEHQRIYRVWLEKTRQVHQAREDGR